MKKLVIILLFLILLLNISLIHFVYAEGSFLLESFCESPYGNNEPTSRCSIYENESVSARIRIGEDVKTYEFKAIKINETYIELEINGQKTIVSKEMINEGKFNFEDIIISIIGIETSSYRSDKYYIVIGTKFSGKFCIDSDVNDKYLDGINLYEKGYVLYSGSEDFSAILNTWSWQDERGDKNSIFETYCDENDKPARKLIICPSNSSLSGGVCSEIMNINNSNGNPNSNPESNKSNCPKWTSHAPDWCKNGTVVPGKVNEKGCQLPPDCITNKTFNLSNGRKAEIKIMPETASQKAIERLGELGFNITLKEVGNGNNTKAVYELTAEKQGKFLGLFKIKGNVAIQVNAETGEVVKVKKPWWAFLASGI